MSSKKWIFLLVIGMISAAAYASTTKVGNGDDGADLEGAEKITSGIILETRKEAILALKVLHVEGIPGLGNVLPELEHSELYMAKSDVHPVSNDGEWESSGDRRTVYARTFAEPYAPTRFFPAAASLSRDQLISLHTHEALHRALPPGVREDEDKVAYLTMAMTSSSATFDRVSRIAKNVLDQPAYTPKKSASATSSLALSENPAAQVAPTPTELSFDYTAANGSDNFNHLVRNTARVGVRFSPIGVKHLWAVPVEPQFSIAGYFDQLPYVRGGHEGPLSFTGKAPFHIGPNEVVGPYAQYNMQSLDHEFAQNYSADFRAIDRDVYSVGGFYEKETARTYNRVLLTYTMPSSYTATNSNPLNIKGKENDTIPAIWSFWAHEGFKVGSRWSLGGIFEFHHVQGYGDLPDAISIVRGGPELRWSDGHTIISASGEVMLNRVNASLDALGDLAGHGSGRTTGTITVAHDF